MQAARSGQPRDAGRLGGATGGPTPSTACVGNWHWMHTRLAALWYHVLCSAKRAKWTGAKPGWDAAAAANPCRHSTTARGLRVPCCDAGVCLAQHGAKQLLATPGPECLPPNSESIARSGPLPGHSPPIDTASQPRHSLRVHRQATAPGLTAEVQGWPAHGGGLPAARDAQERAHAGGQALPAGR